STGGAGSVGPIDNEYRGKNGYEPDTADETQPVGRLEPKQQSSLFQRTRHNAQPFQSSITPRRCIVFRKFVKIDLASLFRDRQAWLTGLALRRRPPKRGAAPKRQASGPP